MATCSKLKDLRDLFETCQNFTIDEDETILNKNKINQGFDAFLVGTEDSHMSEYVSDHDKRREWITGFTGSAGTALITKEEALLWTDGRYFLQAEEELSKDWLLMKSQTTGVPTIEDWLKDKYQNGGRIGIDPYRTSVRLVRSLKKSLKNTKAELVVLHDTEINLIDQIWKNQPQLSVEPVLLHEIQYSGKTIQEKLKQIRSEITSNTKGTALVLPALDDLAWLFNLRGVDISFNPVCLSYGLITLTKAILFVNKIKLPQEIYNHLIENNVEIRPYENAVSEIQTYVTSNPNSQIILDPEQCNFAVYSAIPINQRIESQSIVMKSKAIKNPVELEGLKKAHIRDGAALVKAFAWLEKELMNDNNQVTEIDVANMQEKCRQEMENFVSLSFDTISSIGKNGAIIHYKPCIQNCGIVNKNEMYLNDSGAQYKDGTTDVTRTMHFGIPTEHEKLCYTRVLQAHIALATAIFPIGTEGVKLDTITRTPLWRSGLDYCHGTGHGVGCFLNVHEKGILLSSREGTKHLGIKPGMALSNEPGYYEDGAFGIRIENVIIAKEAKHIPSYPGMKEFCEFETITMAPIQTKLILRDLLSKNEIDWLNSYHQQVQDNLKPFFKDDQISMKYLIEHTKPI